MAESTLALSWTDLQAEVGYFLGYGRTSGDWTAAQLVEIQAVVAAGVRQFYYPPPIGEQAAPHTWSFLQATGSGTATTYNYALPDDFGGMIGDPQYASASSKRRIVETTVEDLLAMRAMATASGDPSYYAIRHLTAPSSTAGQRFEMLLYPTPTSAAITYRYKVLPPALSSAYVYPYGGAEHAETVLASCLAVDEHRMDD